MEKEIRQEFIVTEHYPHRWTSGPSVLSRNPDNGFQPFASLEEAKAYAEKCHNLQPGYEDNRYMTYGVLYKLP